MKKSSKKTSDSLRSRLRRKKRISFKVKGTAERPRLAIFRSNVAFYAQLIDDTAGKTTYGSGRFLYVEKKPADGATFKLDLNRVYNPPCAFSDYTTCPLPPRQNVLKVKIEAGEKYPPRKTG